MAKQTLNRTNSSGGVTNLNEKIFKFKNPLIALLLLLSISLNSIQAIEQKRTPLLGDTRNLQATSARHLNNNNNSQSPTGVSNDEQSQPQDLDKLSSDQIDSSYGGDGLNGNSGDDEVTPDTSTFQAPTDLSIVRLNDTSVVLLWDLAPNLQDHLQFFKIQYKRTNKSDPWKTDAREIPATIRACQINGLRPGNHYFVVNAVYSNDDSKSSEQLKFKIRAQSKIAAEEMPNLEAPDIYWSEADWDYFRFKWRYNHKQKDLEYFGFLVYYRSAHSVSDFAIHNTLDENVEIAELEPDTPYEAKVVAYNNVGVSRFSNLITIKTKSKPTNESTPAPTTIAPPSIIDSSPKITTSTSSRPHSNHNTQDSDERPHHNHHTHNSHHTHKNQYNSSQNDTTQPTKSIIIIGKNSTTGNPAFHWYDSVMDFLIGSQSDDALVIRYSLVVLLAIIFISLLICIMSCQKRQKSSPPSSTNESMQFDLEINGYFKNSFPGVEKEYPNLANHNAHHGFVNNHPHINDFT